MFLCKNNRLHIVLIKNVLTFLDASERNFNLINHTKQIVHNAYLHCTVTSRTHILVTRCFESVLHHDVLPKLLTVSRKDIAAIFRIFALVINVVVCNGSLYSTGSIGWPETAGRPSGLLRSIRRVGR